MFLEDFEYKGVYDPKQSYAHDRVREAMYRTASAALLNRLKEGFVYTIEITSHEQPCPNPPWMREFLLRIHLEGGAPRPVFYDVEICDNRAFRRVIWKEIRRRVRLFWIFAIRWPIKKRVKRSYANFAEWIRDGKGKR
jgi:hypothetical protein